MEACTQLCGKFFPKEVIHITSLSILFGVIGMYGTIVSTISLALQLHDRRTHKNVRRKNKSKKKKK